MENSFDTNPVAQQITKQIREDLFEDMSKRDIKDRIMEAYPDFPQTMFEICYTEAFTTLTENLCQ
jgi:cytochrome c-type biogenesis protein CcmH/NrfF